MKDCCCSESCFLLYFPPKFYKGVKQMKRNSNEEPTKHQRARVAASPRLQDVHNRQAQRRDGLRRSTSCSELSAAPPINSALRTRSLSFGNKYSSRICKVWVWNIQNAQNNTDLVKKCTTISRLIRNEQCFSPDRQFTPPNAIFFTEVI